MTDSPAAPPQSGQPASRQGSRRRLLVGTGALLALAIVAGVAFKVWDRSDDARDAGARAHASEAVEALQGGDVAALGVQLSDNRADPAFAFYFANQATPRELGDAVAAAARAQEAKVVPTDAATGAADSGATPPLTSYERILTDLADALALATRGSGERALPASWTEDFTRYVTTPGLMYGNESSSDQARVDQDVANKQNLLLLLSRARWSTTFLQATTSAFWNWEHQLSGSGDFVPWPGVGSTTATYAPAPSGGYLTDGLVALMAALTANPEAAGWAFASFQPDTATISYDGADHVIGQFARYVFFDHHYSASADGGAGSAGMTASVTALLSAIQATGGSYSDQAAGPIADAFVLEGYQRAAAAEAAADPERWFQKLGHWAKALAHVTLDVAGLVPGVGILPDGVSAAWSAIDGDWRGAGLSVAAMVPFVGEVGLAGKLVKDGSTALKLVDHSGGTIDEATDAGKLLARATGVENGVYDFDNADDFLAALKEPVPGVTYKYGDTTYEVAPDNQLTHLSGPEKDVVAHNSTSESIGFRSEGGQITSGSVARVDFLAKEEQGLKDYEAAYGLAVVRTQVRSSIAGVENVRYFDGLALKPDGTYEAVEVKSGLAVRSVNQAAFDELVTAENPATAMLTGVAIRITSVRLITVQ